MGKRVHVIKKHEEYGNREAFNWQSEDFYYFLENLGCEMCHLEYDYDNFECNVDEYKKALSLVKAYKKYGRCEKTEKMFDGVNGEIDDLEDGLRTLGGIDSVLDDMQAFYKERDKRSGYISFSAW